uniref:EF-hand domain-containing protein n=1 Tax=Fibrocapsa japonica TaxID=94617 RepID=A0A7S2Y2I0_9STRA
MKKFLGRQFDDETISQMLKDADFNQNGTVDFDEFCQLLSKQEDELELEHERRKVGEMIIRHRISSGECADVLPDDPVRSSSMFLMPIDESQETLSRDNSEEKASCS